MQTTSIRTLALSAALVSLVAAPALAQQTPIGVVVNGTVLALDQPPVEQAGRVFVPLRGIFERLGASVVFANGQINATAGRTTVSLTIGQTQAYVDGQPRTLDVAPFLVAGRALVPLRFVAETLGAHVDFETTGPYGRAVIVAATGAAGPPVVVRPVPVQYPTAPAQAAQNLIRVEPAIDGSIAAIRPEISATFAVPTDPDSVKIFIDDRDVTSDAYINDRNFVLHPLFDLPVGRHDVRITGATVAPHARFDERWSFSVESARGENYLRELLPANGAHVGTSFEVRGFSVPHARVHVVATASARSIGFNEQNEDQTIADGEANEDGFFRIHLDVADRGSGVVDVRLTSTSPEGAVTAQTLRLRP